ncbi:DNA-binding response OmpR family regulator [Brachybacterium muris]|nr:DNA-binding response OmpR family regulator [Brachybacterium muris]
MNRTLHSTLRVLHISPAPLALRRPALGALAILPHTVHYSGADLAELRRAPECDVAVFDATSDLTWAPHMAARLEAARLHLPLVLIMAESGLAAANQDWGAADYLLPSSGPAEVDARLRLALRFAPAPDLGPELITAGGLVIDESSYTATLHGQALELTFKEFELLKYLAQHPGRVFTRAQLLQEVWGYDYFGGTRTVDVHVRRLRAKLGAGIESAIHTVRNVGYRFDLVVSEAVPELQSA